MRIVPGLGAFETAFTETAGITAGETGRACTARDILDGGFEEINRPES